jgi:ACS family hexuronate transporter-like MFS transporter
VNVSWHFLVYWMANFFQEQRGLGLLIGGVVTAIPFLAADAGNLAGGAAVRTLTRRGLTTTAARKLVLCGCMVLISSAVWVGLVILAAGPKATAQSATIAALPPASEVAGAVVAALRSDALILFLLSLAALGTAAYMVNYFAFGQDVAPRHTGLVIGYLGGLGNLFAAGFLPLAGYISERRYGHAPNFVIVGLLPLAGLVTLLLFWGRDEAKPTPSPELELGA